VSNAGSTDAFVAKFGQLLPPVFTSISPDTDSSSSDQVTSSQNLTLYGNTVANATVTLYRPGVGSIGTTTASSAGLFTFSYSGTTLAAGSYGFTATANSGGQTSAESVPFLVTVDTTAPVVTLSAPASTVDPNPQLVVVATDLVGLPATATVTLDVDKNDNGSFSDPGETGYQTATMTNGVAVFNLSPALSPGTYPMRARVSDLAGNQGTSAVVTMTLSATGSAWTITDTNWRDGPPSKDEPLYYYRPWKTILVRTVADGGQSFYIQGDHRQTIPALWHLLTSATGAGGAA
jgi:Big-like domain-containing protein